jgi:hypothetical protein
MRANGETSAFLARAQARVPDFGICIIALTKQQLEKAILIADDPTPRIFPIVCPTHDVSRALLLERLFRLTDHAHFRNCVDAGR